MKQLLIILLTLFSLQSFAQQKYVVKVQGTPGIAKADSVNGYVTPTQLKSKINYTDSSSMLSPYLRKNDTTGKWISPAVANATYATISNLNGKLDKSDSTIANRVTNLQNTKANDNNVIHPTGNETASSKWLNNSYIALGGELSDLGMTGLFDRNELTNADLRGTVTVTQYTSGAASDVTSLAPAMFDGSGNFSSFVETSGSSDSLKVLIDLGANVLNYSAGYWQPFVAFRLPYDLFKNIKVEVSTDNSTWTTSNTPSSWSFNSTSQVFFPTGYWMGAKDYCANLASTWRYIRFSFKNPSNTDPYVYISEIGMRHSSAPYARQYLLKAGDNIYGRLNLMNKATTMGYIDPLTGTFTGIFSGNSSSATKLQTARNINGVPFDGTSNITVTDATKEPTITAGTTSQYWSGNKTWQNVSSLPVQTAVQTALNAKLDTSFRQNLYAADPILFPNDSTITVRQSFVDSLRNASFTSSMFGLSKDGNNPIFNQAVVLNNKAIYFSGQGNLYQNIISPLGYNGGIYITTNSNGSYNQGAFASTFRENLTITPTGMGIDGLNIPTAKLEIKASTGKAGDAPIKIQGGKLLSVLENGAIERDSASERLFDTHLGIRDKITYESDLKNYLTKDSIGNRDYSNDSTAVADGHLGLYDFYRTGNIVKVVATMPVFTGLTYTVDHTSGANDSTQFYISFVNTDSLSVNWGDGSSNNYPSATTYTPTHKYATTGTFIVALSFSSSFTPDVRNFWINNYPYATKITNVTDLDKLVNATNIDLANCQSLSNSIVDFAYPPLTSFGLHNCGLTSFVPTHNLPAGLTNLNLGANKLNSAAVDSTLNWLANTQTFAAGPKTLDISQGSLAPPTSASATAITTLQSRGWTITHD